MTMKSHSLPLREQLRGLLMLVVLLIFNLTSSPETFTRVLILATVSLALLMAIKFVRER